VLEHQAMKTRLEVGWFGWVRAGRSVSWMGIGLVLTAFAVAPARAGEPAAAVKLRADAKPAAGDFAPSETFSEEQRSHWSYQPVSRPDVPEVKESRWVRNPVDRFILADLETTELPHSPEADRLALIRRLTFDLTGLPPRPEEVRAFVDDPRPDAYERLVDRLLASPRYGERWAQHWLDLAHYADTNGFELDAERPDAWRYRDWVVRALNADMPYDRFTALQIAGDEIAPNDHAALIATGFCRCGPREVVGGNIIPEEKRQSELTEITSTVGSVFLGMTIGCARCHDHKFEAIPTTDYYRLQSFFAGSELTDVPIASQAEKDAYAAARKAIGEKIAPILKKLAALEAPYRKAIKDEKTALLSPYQLQVLAIPAAKRTPEQKRLAAGVQTSLRVTWEAVAEAVSRNPADHAERERLKRAIDAIEKTAPRPPAEAMAIVDPKPDAPITHVFRRGNYLSKGPKVAPRPPGVVLASQPADAFPSKIEPMKKSAGRRTALARWLTRPDNPLTARVIVNRVWQYHFGKGLVGTASDFGIRGEPPSNPDLLDWLTSEFIAGGWRLKSLHRLLVTSAVYRQTSARNATLDAGDPENTLYGRMFRRRLDAEGIRDAMLAASGELNDQMGGPGILAPLEKEVEDLIFTEAEVVDLWPENPDPAQRHRRSLYLFRKRNVRYPMFEAFDAPDTQNACPRRETSTHSLQALNLLNGDFATGRARAFAERVLREAGPTAEDRIERAYHNALGRQPSHKELARAKDFLQGQSQIVRDEARKSQATAVDDSIALAAWVDLARVILNSNEFIYVP
jgi:hypothetical protein